MEKVFTASENTYIHTADDMLDWVMNMQYLYNCDTFIINSAQLNPAFFDLKTGLAGEMLQKIVNYNLRLGIVGDFSVFQSKSLHDFIRESNKSRRIVFADTVENAKELLNS